MFLLFALVFGLISLQAQVVLSRQFKLQFPNGVQQCQPVSVSFSGNTSYAVVAPMTLTVLPFNSTPISIPLSNTADAPTGVYVTFLPIAAGTNFVASLDDSSHGNIARVSDVIRVLPSSSGNDTCLPASSEDVTKEEPFRIDGVLSQCENMTVNYNTALVNKAPRVRLYNPNGPSFALNVTSDDPLNGVATYQVSISRGKEVLLLVDDGRYFQTTNLLTVDGDTSSSSECVMTYKDGDNYLPNTGSVMMGSMDKGAKSGIPQSVIIGTSVGGALILLLAIAMIWFVFRERRRKKEGDIRFDAAQVERGEKPAARISAASIPAPAVMPPALYDGAVANPLYTYPRNSLASWSQPVPEDQKVPRSKQNSLSSSTRSRPRSREQDGASDRTSLESLDIEGMLNMATVQSERLSRQTTASGPAPLSPDLTPAGPQLAQFLNVPARTAVRPYPSRGHLRNPSDVPRDPTTSPTLSNFSIDPFSDENVIADSSPILRSFAIRSPLSAIRAGSFIGAGLPSSPRNGPRFSTTSAGSVSINIMRDSGTPRRSSRGSANGDNYGIAR